jgi:hypothetical protein
MEDSTASKLQIKHVVETDRGHEFFFVRRYIRQQRVKIENVADLSKVLY